MAGNSSMLLTATICVFGAVLVTGAALAQTDAPPPPKETQPPMAQLPAMQAPANLSIRESGAGVVSGTMLQVPVSHLFPGGVNPRPPIANPVAADPGAADRGMKYFNSFNCVGCHAANGAGGMGPSLSNGTFIYGAQPENIFLSIYQGRPHGMPAWGGSLPETVIWDIVTYIQNLSNAPNPEWGTTISATSPAIEQVPAGVIHTTKPWQHTQRFSNGQKP